MYIFSQYFYTNIKLKLNVINIFFQIYMRVDTVTFTLIVLCHNVTLNNKILLCKQYINLGIIYGIQIN